MSRPHFKEVTWVPGLEAVPRGGMLGWVIDILIGMRYMRTGPALFVALSEDGRVITSPDGLTWTLRTVPEIEGDAS